MFKGIDFINGEFLLDVEIIECTLLLLVIPNIRANLRWARAYTEMADIYSNLRLVETKAKKVEKSETNYYN